MIFNQFGGTIGGPIKRNKLFYFLSYDGVISRQSYSTFTTVPTDRAKTGDLSESKTPIYDPATGNPDGTGRTPFPGNQIPVSWFSEPTKKILPLWPEPNMPGLVNNYFVSASAPYDRSTVDAKVSYNASSKLTVTGRLGFLDWSEYYEPVFGIRLGGRAISGQQAGPANGNSINLTGAVTYVLRPSLVIDGYFGFNSGLTFPGDPGFPRAGTHSHLANFAPRVGIVWDPLGNAKTVVRAGYGVLYDLPAMQYFDRFGFGPPWASAITLNNPAGGFTDPYRTYPGGDPFPLPIPPKSDAIFASAGQYVNLPLHIHPTNFQQWNLSLQEQLSSDWPFSLNYLGNKGTHLWVVKKGNPAVYIPGQCGSSPCSTVANTNSRRIFSRLNPQAGSAFSSLATVDDGGNSSYNAMLATLNHRLRKHFSLLLNYTWSHCINENGIQSEISGGYYQDPNNRAGNRGNCNTDIRQIFNASLVAGTPHLTKSLAGRLIGDWELSTIVTARSGFWFSPGTGTDASLTGVGADRPNVTGNANDINNPSINKWFNTAAFSKNQPGTYGNAGRDSIVGPGSYRVDMALFRNFPFAIFEKPQSLQLRIEAFNALNHPSFDNPNATLNSSNFGKILGASDPRIMQIALKYIF